MENPQISRKEAADILGVSVRTVNRYVVAGHLHCTYEHPARGGCVPRYDRAQVEELAHRRNASERRTPEAVCH